MQKIVTLFFILCALAGCVSKMDIEQGNLMTPERVNQLKIGMTEQQVTALMGTPVLMNTFDKSRVDYVYTCKPGHGVMTEKLVTLIFRNHRLVSIEGNMYSHVIL